MVEGYILITWSGSSVRLRIRLLKWTSSALVMLFVRLCYCIYFSLLLLMYACSSVYVFFLLCYFIYFVCVFSISLSDLTFFRLLACGVLAFFNFFIIVINLRFGVYTFLPHKTKV